MAAPAIEVRDLTKVYRLGVAGGGFFTLRDRLAALFRPPSGDTTPQFVRALDQVDLRVEAGEVLGIIGSNGAGKSTLLKILSRITTPSGGEVILRGRSTSLLEVGTGFHPELTGRENIFLNGVILGMKRAEIQARFDEIVAFSGVERFLDTPVKRYSSGMYVRLAFSVAAHLNSEILIVDEVLAVGDAQFQNRCLGTMGEVARSGRTVLFVSHNLQAVEQLCDRAVLLESGRLTNEGEPHEIVRQHINQSLQLQPAKGDFVDEKSGITFRFLRAGANHREAGGFLVCGAPGTIHVQFHFPHPLGMSALHIGIYTRLGTHVALLTTELSSSPGENGEVVGGVDALCQIDKCPLLPGSYEFRLAVLSYGSVVLFMPCAALVRVQSPVDETQTVPSSGLVFIPSAWTVRRLPA